MDRHADPLVSHRRRSATPPGELERAVSTMTGAALLVRGAARRDLTGWLALAAGGTLVVRSLTGRRVVPRALLEAGPVEAVLVRAVTVGARPESVLELSRQPERWLPGDLVQAVAADGGRWRVEYALGPLRGSWETTLSEQSGAGWLASPVRPDSPLAGIEVSVEEAPDARGCELRVRVTLRAGGATGYSLQALRGVAERALGHALQRFRQVLETGEVARSHPQPHGRRGVLAALVAGGKEAS
jgi:uncharacterized membrane protein